ncbi:MAG: NAD(+)/NADH kinase [Syntrophothermus sp.]|uniref:NAD(+)/NADH kinase n=1 Tax=Syntrophothermus sp. TaxID=2736299 RepID=UPI00257ADF5E|nr:NAD(+)/NADH kinase [Syntrophothermus sp.]NSW82871.1 NAD(+)/NADH kinase [Syntrophothermus sp.]
MQVVIVYKNDCRATLLARDLHARLSCTKGVDVTVLTSQDLPNYNYGAEVVFVLGGDGTVLRAARHFSRLGAPILGVNLGKIGFLSSVEPEEVMASLDKILRQEYVLEERLMLQAVVIKNKKALLRAVALNDVVIRSATPHIVTLNLQLNGKTLVSYRGDGVICATPTGSTGYSLSAGGPILSTSVAAIVITPISPQFGSARSLVVGADSRLEFVVDSDRKITLSIDGEETIFLASNDKILVERASEVARFIQLKPVVGQLTKLWQRMGSVEETLRLVSHNQTP